MATEKKSHARNAPKIGYSDNKGVYAPGAFKIVKFDILDSSGNKKDVRKMIESFTISAELFSPVLTLSASLRDTGDLFKDKFEIHGQENIEIEIDPLHSGNDAIKHTFSIKEYPSVVRSSDSPHTQIYTLLAISEFAYRSSLMNICRVLDPGKSLDQNIKTIFVDDLKQDDLVTYGKVETKFKGIINIQRPLQAAEWLRSRCFDEDGSPFFLYSNTTRPKEIFLSSWKDISKNAIVSTYTFNSTNDVDPGSAEHTKAERNRLLDMSSSIKLDRLKSANSGAYASRYNIIDFSAKAFYILDFNGKATSDWKPRTYSIKDRSGIDQTATMHKIPSSNVVTLQVNTAVSELSNSSNDISAIGVYNSITSCHRYLPSGRALYARINEATHEVIVYGDTTLQPGEKIKLRVPKTKISPDDKSNEQDKIASGEYIILVVASIFVDGIFTNKLKVAKLVPSVGGNLLSPDGTSNIGQTADDSAAENSNASNSAQVQNDTGGEDQSVNDDISIDGGKYYFSSDATASNPSPTNNTSSGYKPVNSESSLSDPGKYYFSGASPVSSSSIDTSLLPPLPGTAEYDLNDPDALPPNFNP
jgi:hypothetical protein